MRVTRPTPPPPTKPPTEKRRRGDAAESRACRYLELHGLQVIARNYRCKAGEVDIVARDDAVVVFVEVRLRMSERFGGAAASIGHAKRRRIVFAAQHYLNYALRVAAGARLPACRIDVVLVSATELEWIRNAFPAE
jgi:putative endonuclease